MDRVSIAVGNEALTPCNRHSCELGTNFGSQHSMVEQCSIFTHYHQSEEERQELGIGDTLIRFNVGFEPLADLIADLENALKYPS